MSCSRESTGIQHFWMNKAYLRFEVLFLSWFIGRYADLGNFEMRCQRANFKCFLHCHDWEKNIEVDKGRKEIVVSNSWRNKQRYNCLNFFKEMSKFNWFLFEQGHWTKFIFQDGFGGHQFLGGTKMWQQ